MSCNYALKIENLSKCYQIYPEPRDRLKQMILPRLQGLINLQTSRFFHDFWALKDISFNVRKGEVVGIIGCNGSGKSTLLQLICGTLNQTAGTIHVGGRIAALLELGSGFNPEFTGLENAYMNASILGLSHDEIEQRLDEIIQFAGIGDFIHQPVKHYSSGMMVRLAFAVSVSVEPDILIIDEALAVGDELFQRKCFSRISFLRERGTTILFVSHSAAQIIELCDRAILLDAGELIFQGRAKDVVGKYQKLIYAPQDSRDMIRSSIKEDFYEEYLGCDVDKSNQSIGFNSVRKFSNSSDVDEAFDPNLKPQSTVEYEQLGAAISEPKIFTMSHIQVNNLNRGIDYKFVYTVKFNTACTNLRFSMLIKSTSGLELGGGISAPDASQGIPYIEAYKSIQVEFTFTCNLNPGVYFLNAGVMGSVGEDEIYLHRILDASVFRVISVNENTSTCFVDFNCHSTFINSPPLHSLD